MDRIRRVYECGWIHSVCVWTGFIESVSVDWIHRVCECGWIHSVCECGLDS